MSLHFNHTAGTVIGTLLGLFAAMGGHEMLSHRQMDFATTHGLSHGCFKQLRWQKLLGELAAKVCFIFIFLSAIVFGMALVMTGALLFSRPTAREIPMVVAPGGGLTCLAGGLLAEGKVVCWYIPSSMKCISKPPFQLVGFQKR